MIVATQMRRFLPAVASPHALPGSVVRPPWPLSLLWSLFDLMHVGLSRARDRCHHVAPSAITDYGAVCGWRRNVHVRTLLTGSTVSTMTSKPSRWYRGTLRGCCVSR